MRGRGGYIGFNRVPAAAAVNSAASGVWTLREAESLKRAGTWPLVVTDEHYLSVSTFLSFDGINGSTLFTDATGNVTWSANGNASISTSSPYNGTGSLVLDGNGDWINTTNNSAAPGSGDFTLEMWVYLDAANNTVQGLYSNHNDANGLDKFFIYINNTNKMSVVAYEGNWAGEPAVTFPAQQWTHVAVSRVSGTLRLFQGGQIVGQVTNTQNFSRNIVTIGRVYTDLPGASLAGKIDLFRITKGVGRYSAAFTPGSYSYP